jgi:hypothetical protein
MTKKNPDLVFDGERWFVWNKCATEGCSHNVCTWGSHSLCYPCEEKIVGKEEMDRRYKATRFDPSKPGPMIRTFAELNN